ncbi:hypothetical protein BXY58_2037 [Epilithonimonas arachidiradicis]|uniref:Uncharacterized protein n=1 Tax=Epilithonimonas arachidiradicis TaxID=1617282 RepID=A0A420D940_9FLAO|nr:hypothetical protein BXY58_2037 [Epilithonimonas arachidiradicis]
MSYVRVPSSSSKFENKKTLTAYNLVLQNKNNNHKNLKKVSVVKTELLRWMIKQVRIL